MKSEQAYHILYFSPDLVSGERFAVGAFVRDMNGRGFVAAEHRPGPACVGGVRQHQVLEVITDRASEVQDWESAVLKRALGQYVELGPEVAVQHRVPDLARWVVRHVLPRADEGAKAPGPSRVRRDSAGRQYFEQRNVSHLVGGRFRPQQFWHSETVSRVESGLTATHWVNGGDRVLMLEPVLVRDQDHGPRDVLKQILALQKWLERVPSARDSQVGAYVLHGGPKSARTDAVMLMQDATDLVFDVADPDQADALDERVRSVAERRDLLRVDVN
jgi:hypothetical protein